MNKNTVSSLLRAVAVALCVAASFTLPAAARSGGAAPSHAGATVDACSWDRPGHDPFMGDVVAAVDRYEDIAPQVRERLKARMVRRDYDDVVSIRRDTITGRSKARYGSTIHDMHFGNAKLCHSVTRAAWSAQMQERGLVYCESGQCILVPTVCRNVSRIARAEVSPAHAEGDVPEIETPPVAALDLLPPAVALDLGGAPVLTAGAGPGADSPLGGYFPGGGGSGSAGAFASFAGGGSGGRSGFTPLAAGQGRDDVSAPESSAPQSTPITPVPEPETWALMAAGLAALAARRRRRT